MDLKITPSGQTIVKPTALGPGANTDTKLLIYGLFQKGRVLAQDGVATLERLVAAKGLADSPEFDARKEAWADAYRRTPHGKPVVLPPTD